MLTQLSRLPGKAPRRVIATVFLLLVLLFLVIYLKDVDWSKLQHLQFRWLPMVISAIIAIIYRYWMVTVWRAILRALGSKQLPSLPIMARIYAKAWMARYIPGTVTWIASKIYMASSYGISKSRLTVSSLLEGGMQVVAVTIVSLFILGLNPHLSSIPIAARWLVVAVSAACLVVLFPPVFNRLLRGAYMLLRGKAPYSELRINGRAVLVSFSLFALGAFINGASSYFIVRAIVPGISADTFFFIVGAFGISGAIGIATPLVPSGAGTRDAALLVLLTAIMPKELALAVTVFTRLWQVFCDTLFLGITGLIYRMVPGSETRAQTVDSPNDPSH